MLNCHLTDFSLPQNIQYIHIRRVHTIASSAVDNCEIETTFFFVYENNVHIVTFDAIIFFFFLQSFTAIFIGYVQIRSL